jgi:hypothetical protein
MKALRRFALAFATVATVGTGATLAVSATPVGASLLRAAGHNLVVTAHAGPIGGGGTMTITITGATLVGKVDAIAHVDYVCDQMYDPFTGQPVTASQTSGNMSVSIQQKVGSSVANGFGSASITPACDRTPTFAGTPNHVDVLVAPNGAAYRKGTAVAQAFGQACESGFVSFGPPPCDSGQSDPTVITISR